MLKTLKKGGFLRPFDIGRGLHVSCRPHGLVREQFFAALRGQKAADQMGPPDVSISEYGWEIKTEELDLAPIVVRR